MDPAGWERIIEVNLLGVYRTINVCLPHVIERRGYVLPVASIAAAVHAPGMSAYSATKAGVEALGDSLRGEVKHLGVDVGVAYYSWIDTDMVRGADTHPAAQFMRGEAAGPGGQDLHRRAGRRDHGGGHRGPRAPDRRAEGLPRPPRSAGCRWPA